VGMKKRSFSQVSVEDAKNKKKLVDFAAVPG
jgi:predicted CopG family antitoxin